MRAIPHLPGNRTVPAAGSPRHASQADGVPRFAPPPAEEDNLPEPWNREGCRDPAVNPAYLTCEELGVWWELVKPPHLADISSANIEDSWNNDKAIQLTSSEAKDYGLALACFLDENVEDDVSARDFLLSQHQLVREETAIDTKSEKILGFLASDSSLAVRTMVADNIYTSGTVLEKLLKDDNRQVRAAAKSTLMER